MDLLTWWVRILVASELGLAAWYCWRARRYDGPFVAHMAWVGLTLDVAMWWYVVVAALEWWSGLPLTVTISLRRGWANLVWLPCLWRLWLLCRYVWTLAR